MTRSKLFTLLASTALCIIPLTSHADAGQPLDIVYVGDLPGGFASAYVGGISTNGTTIVGYSSGNNGDEAFLWTEADDFIGLGDLTGGSYYSSAKAVNADGTIIVGESDSTNGTKAFRWTLATGMEELGDLAGGSLESSAYGISANGSVIVGYSNSANGDEAFRWTLATGMEGLGDLTGGGFSSYANAVSADGTVIVGRGNGVNGNEAFRWTLATGMEGLGDLAGGNFNSGAFGISSDGTVIVGGANSANGNEAFRWTRATGMVGLGDLAGGVFDSYASAASSNGSVIVGKGDTATGSTAIIWTEARGMTSILDDLSTAGVDVSGWDLATADGVSGDGSIVVGRASYYGDTVVFLVNVETNGLTTPTDLNESLNTVAEASQTAANITGQFIPQTLFLARHINTYSTPLRSASYPKSMGGFAPAAGDDIIQSNASVFMLGSYSTDNNFDSNQYNGTVGISMNIAPDLNIGAGVIGSSATTDLDFNGNSNADALGGVLLASYQPLDTSLRLYGTVYAAHLSVDTKRGYLNGSGQDFSNGKTDGFSYGAAARVGWETGVINDQTSIMPYIEARYSKTKLDAYTEQGGSFASSFSEQKDDSVSSRLGVEIKHQMNEKLELLFRPAWGHRISGDGASIEANTGGLTQYLQSNAGDRNWAEATIGGTWQATDKIQLSTELTGRTGDTAEPVGTVTLGAFMRF